MAESPIVIERGDHLKILHLNKITMRYNQRLQCKYCAKEFGKMYNLKDHIRIHLGLKKFKCKYCHKKYV